MNADEIVAHYAALVALTPGQDEPDEFVHLAHAGELVATLEKAKHVALGVCAVLDLCEFSATVEAIGFENERYIPSAAIRAALAGQR